MASITYVATRKIASGHSVDTAYSMDVSLSQFSSNFIVNDKRHESISGHVESWVGSTIGTYLCETKPLLESNALHGYMWEFLASCIGGETFTFDPWGTIASPDDPQDYILISKTISPARHGGIFRCESFPFEIRQIV